MDIDPAPAAPVRFALIGPAGPMLYYMCTLLRHLVIGEQIPFFHEYWPQTEAETEDLLSRVSDESFLIGTQYPSAALVEWLRQERIPTIVALDTPLNATCHYMETCETDYLVATTAITMSLAMTAETALLPYRVVVSRQHAHVRLRHLLMHLGRFCLGQPPEDPDALMARLKVAPEATLKDALEQTYFDTDEVPVRLGLSETASREIDLACAPLMAILLGEQADISIQWAPSFFLDKSYARPAAALQELVGPARCLFYGPYLHLPRGEYSGEFAFGLSNEIRDMLLRIQAVNGDNVDEFVTRAQHGGLYTFPFDLFVRDAGKPVEVCLLMDRGEIEGWMGFAYVRLTPKNLLST